MQKIGCDGRILKIEDKSGSSSKKDFLEAGPLVKGLFMPCDLAVFHFRASRLTRNGVEDGL